MTTDALLDWMRGHRPDPHVCPVHGSIVLYSEHGVGMCLRCCWDLRAELTRNPTPGEEHLRDHDTPRAWCHYCRAGL